MGNEGLKKWRGAHGNGGWRQEREVKPLTSQAGCIPEVGKRCHRAAKNMEPGSFRAPGPLQGLGGAICLRVGRILCGSGRPCCSAKWSRFRTSLLYLWQPSASCQLQTKGPV